jgi:hypothetical protein
MPGDFTVYAIDHRTISIALAIGLAACPGFQPRIGMTLEDWRNECRIKNLSSGQLVRAERDIEVYYCDNVNVFHYFKDGILVRIDQGQLPKQQIELEIKH